MKNKYAFLRVPKDTAHKLKVLAAVQRESMLAIVERLVTVECERINLVVAPEKEDPTDE